MPTRRSTTGNNTNRIHYTEYPSPSPKRGEHLNLYESCVHCCDSQKPLWKAIMNRYPASVQRGHKARNDYARRETPGFFHWRNSTFATLTRMVKTKTCGAFTETHDLRVVDVWKKWKLAGNWLEIWKIWEARIGKLFRFCRSAMFNNFRKCWSFFFFVFAFDISFISLEWSNYYSTCSQFLFSFDDNDSKVVSLNGWLVSNRHEYQRFGIIFCVDTKTSFLLNDQLCIYPIVQPLQNSIIFQE